MHILAVFIYFCIFPNNKIHKSDLRDAVFVSLVQIKVVFYRPFFVLLKIQNVNADICFALQADLARRTSLLIRIRSVRQSTHFKFNSFCENSLYDLLDLLALRTVDKSLADARKVAFLVQLPHLPIHPWPGRLPIPPPP